MKLTPPITCSRSTCGRWLGTGGSWRAMRAVHPTKPAPTSLSLPRLLVEERASSQLHVLLHSSGNQLQGMRGLLGLALQNRGQGCWVVNRPSSRAARNHRARSGRGIQVHLASACPPPPQHPHLPKSQTRARGACPGSQCSCAHPRPWRRRWRAPRRRRGPPQSPARGQGVGAHICDRAAARMRCGCCTPIQIW